MREKEYAMIRAGALLGGILGFVAGSIITNWAMFGYAPADRLPELLMVVMMCIGAIIGKLCDRAPQKQRPDEHDGYMDCLKDATYDD